MTLERFEKLVAAYGASTENWPPQERAAMAGFLNDNADAPAILARAARLDALLDSRLPQADDQLEARILRDMDTVLASDIIALPQSTATPAHMVWSVATALAACFVGGLIAGPALVETYIGGNHLMTSLDIISDVFLPTEPL